MAYQSKHANPAPAGFLLLQPLLGDHLTVRCAFCHNNKDELFYLVT